MPKSKPPRTSGPTRPIAGLDLEVQEAAADALTPARAAQLLASLREGDGAADALLTAGFRHLVYVAARNDRYGVGDLLAYRTEWFGVLFVALVTAIRRLRSNLKPDAETEIRKELARAIRGYGREVSRNLLPRSSTNSMRKKRGLDPHPALKYRTKVERQSWDADNSQRWIDPFDDPRTLSFAGRIDSRPVSADLEAQELIHAILQTPLQRAVIGLKAAGFTESAIAESVGITRHQVRRIFATIRERADRLAA